MSGGSYDYAYIKVGVMSNDLLRSGDPLRKAFGQHLKLVAEAMHDVQQVDSGDYGEDDERAAIEVVLGEGAKIKALIVEAGAILEQLSEALKKSI